MATHSGILAWKIPWTEEPRGLHTVHGVAKELDTTYRQNSKTTTTTIYQLYLILYHLLIFLHSIFPSTRVFSNELALHIRWQKYWNFSISPFNDYSGLISFRIDWFDLLAAQGTLKSLLQHHNSKASILRCSAFFMVQLSFRTWLPEKQ